MGKLCSKCKMNSRAQNGRQRWCLSCRNKREREKRVHYWQLTEKEKEKSNCRAYFNVYKRRGKVEEEVCQVWGSERAEAHHPDYKRPLFVLWLCREHHLFLHRILEMG